MKRQLLFVQGGGAQVHDEWDSKLVVSLKQELGPDYEVRYPRMPKEDDPDFAAWKTMLQEQFAQRRKQLAELLHRCLRHHCAELLR